MDVNTLYDRALSTIGQNGKFQKRFDIIYNIVLSGLWTMAYYNIILALTIVPHNCTLPDRPQNISEHSWKLTYIPITKDSAGETGFSSCLIYTSNNQTTKCTTYDHDKTWYSSTISSDNNWFCEAELYVTNILTFSRIGETVGSLFFGWFGDTYGRKPTYIISLALLIFGRVIVFLASHSFTLLAIGCIISAFPSTSALQSISVISIEISSPKRRSTIAKLRFITSSFGMSLMPILYWWLKDWKTFLVLTTVTQLPYLLMSCRMIESPQWLWVNKNNERCIREMNRISRANKTILDRQTENEILNSSSISKRDGMGPIALFSSRKLAFNTILQLIMWVSVTLSYSMSLLSSGEKADGNPFLEFAWQSLAEIPAHFTAAWLADCIGRRFTGVISSGLTAVMWALLGLRSFDIAGWMNSSWISTVLGVVNRFSITISYYIINLLNMELHPTCLRQSGMSLGNVISGIASSIAPYVLYVSHQNGVLLSASVLSFVSVLGAMSAYYLPETLNAKLPETIEEARQFGNCD